MSARESAGYVSITVPANPNTSCSVLRSCAVVRRHTRGADGTIGAVAHASVITPPPPPPDEGPVLPGEEDPGGVFPPTDPPPSSHGFAVDEPHAAANARGNRTTEAAFAKR